MTSYSCQAQGTAAARLVESRKLESNALSLRQALAPHCTALRTHAPLPRTSTSRCRVTATSSSGPSLLLATKRSDVWELKYEELMNYKEEHGDCDVPQSMGALGDWVFDQRISYTKGSLAKERVGRLDDIGFTWRFVTTDGAAVLSKLRRWEELWDWRYRELKEYREKHGDCNVPQRQGSLGRWVNDRRQDYREGKLSNERIARLESIGFVWDRQEHRWSEYLNELTDYEGLKMVTATFHSRMVNAVWGPGLTNSE
ncbi:hypothetical protein THAOC_22454 [Thalassiosira oceanica]|uniref:Helicase-associated domain-containing protein n=1 Tax=Thalassiosira oceanica TaxID=159749 RepID=K0RYD2_THAOC|nr:hypothetical protein THAOC_22454 [Thalassiosira oceanica]|eukprot:EJK57494.1 hypothetical protein THAOC_22454 [Thalassiosira oceanica]